MNIRTLLRRNPPTNPAHVPTYTEEREQEIRDLARAEIMHILDVFDPSDIRVKGWPQARRLPLNHRDQIVWALLGQAYERIQNVRGQVAA